MNLGFFGPKMAISWSICFFKKKFAETPIFIVFFGCAHFGPSCQKREFWTPTQKRRKFSLITEKLIFEYVRATSLGPKPSLFVFFVCFLLLFVFFLVPFLSLLLIEKPDFSPWKRHFWFIFSVSLSSSLNLFWPPPFLFVFLCLSFALVFLSSFLSFFGLSFCFLFLSLFHCSFFFAFVSSIEQHENIKLQFILFINMFSFFGFLSCFLFEIYFSYLCFFLILSYVFCSTSLFLVSNNPSWKTPMFGHKGGCNITVFFMNLCFAKCEKLSFFLGGLFFGKFLVAFQKAL